jgi:HlyD family secretion protein
MKKCLIIVFTIFLIDACKEKELSYDASGTFEAVETIVSAEANGVIKSLGIEEGQVLKAGQDLGYVDSLQLFLKKRQLEAQIKATGSRLPDIKTQTSYYKQQQSVTQTRLNYLQHERERIKNLIKADAATTKQLDDINNQIDETQKQILVIEKQSAAQVSLLNTQNSGLRSDIQPLVIQIEQINDQLQKCRIVNPVNGTVLTKYAENNEMTMVGKPLYKIADLSSIVLRAYVSGDQFAQVKSGQMVTVMVDDGTGKYREYSGKIEWISDKAEFTPKTIQTKDERANLVYAVKIRVKNDGYLKIGMYGEVKLATNGSGRAQ